MKRMTQRMKPNIILGVLDALLEYYKDIGARFSFDIHPDKKATAFVMKTHDGLHYMQQVGMDRLANVDADYVSESDEISDVVRSAISGWDAMIETTGWDAEGNPYWLDEGVGQ